LVKHQVQKCIVMQHFLVTTLTSEEAVNFSEIIQAILAAKFSKQMNSL
jgi:BarA-like signal transduction histidine kinase